MPASCNSCFGKAAADDSTCDALDQTECGADSKCNWAVTAADAREATNVPALKETDKYCSDFSYLIGNNHSGKNLA